MARVLRIRFFEKVGERNERGCRPWLASCVTKGYGAFWLNGKQELAHRVAFFLEHGRWPEPFGLHTCDNRWCCEASHVFEGTHADNMEDMRSKGRGDPNRGMSNGMARLTDEAVRAIRTRAKATRAYAAEFGVSQAVVSKAQRGQTWRHVIP